MRAIIIKQFGGLDSLVIENLPDPVPQPGSVLIQVRLPGLSGLDFAVRLGSYGSAYSDHIHYRPRGYPDVGPSH